MLFFSLFLSLFTFSPKKTTKRNKNPLLVIKLSNGLKSSIFVRFGQKKFWEQFRAKRTTLPLIGRLSAISGRKSNFEIPKIREILAFFSKFSDFFFQNLTFFSSLSSLIIYLWDIRLYLKKWSLNWEKRSKLLRVMTHMIS